MMSPQRKSSRRLLAWAGLVVLLSSSPCFAAARYSFADLGLAKTNGPISFDAAGQVNPNILFPADSIHTQAGDYSIGNQVVKFHGQIDEQLAFFYAKGQAPVELDAVVGYGSLTHASAVNQSGTVVGTDFNVPSRDGYFGAAFTYSQAGGMQAVPLPYPAANTFPLSAAYSINDAGLIVGAITNGNGTIFPGYSSAFLSDGKTSWDLNTLIAPGSSFLLSSATDINDAGQIVGTAYDAQFHPHYYLLTPTATPEPSTLLVLAAGGLALGLRRMARRARNRARQPQ